MGGVGPKKIACGRQQIYTECIAEYPLKEAT
jgi:hypothetical protein